MHLYLIGYRGSGKTTIGKYLASRLDLPFVDTDELIQQAASKNVREIFETEGEEGFRHLESETISEVSEQSSSVVSLGGGAILAEPNRKCIAASGKTVWLHADAGILFARIESSHLVDQRPPLSDLDPEQEIKQLLQDRSVIYEACADYMVDTGVTPIDQAVEEIAQWWESVDK